MHASLILIGNKMQYESLFRILPKYVREWNSMDVGAWLTHINIGNLYPRFRELSIDGSCIKALDEVDIREQLKAKSAITVKKLMQWVEVKFQEYDRYLESEKKWVLHSQKKIKNRQQRKRLRRSSFTSIKSIETQESSINKLDESRHRNLHKIQTTLKCSLQSSSRLNEEFRSFKSNEQIVVNRPYKGECFLIKNFPFKIGSFSNCEIDIKKGPASFTEDTLVAINKKNNLIYAQNFIGPSYIKIDQDPFLIIPENQDLLDFRIGSNEIKVEFIQDEGTGAKKRTKAIVIVENEPSSSGSVVRRDKIMVDHCRVVLYGKTEQARPGQFFLHPHIDERDRSFANKNPIAIIERSQDDSDGFILEPLIEDSWVRMKENLKFKVKIGSTLNISGHIFRIGVQKKKEEDQFEDPDICTMCYVKKRDCVILNCGHFASCIRCIWSQEKCPICRQKIEEVVKINTRESADFLTPRT